MSPSWSTTPAPSTRQSLLAGAVDLIRLEMDTHYFGTLSMTRAFAPVIEGNGGGTILNVLSVLSWLHPGALGRTPPPRPPSGR
jgi:NAD(P)-dependent dehydrogenase (short-subunit alcohol dehydrogenase family)